MGPWEKLQHHCLQSIHKTVFARKHPLTSVQLGWSSFFFFFSITGNWGVEVVGWGAWDCECWDELTVMQFGMLHFSNKIGSCAVFPQDRKKNTLRMTFIPGTLKILPPCLIDWWLFYGLWGLANVKGFGIWFWKIINSKLNLSDSLGLFSPWRSFALSLELMLQPRRWCIQAHTS